MVLYAIPIDFGVLIPKIGALTLGSILERGTPDHGQKAFDGRWRDRDLIVRHNPVGDSGTHRVPLSFRVSILA